MTHATARDHTTLGRAFWKKFHEDLNDSQIRTSTKWILISFALISGIILSPLRALCGCMKILRTFHHRFGLAGFIIPAWALLGVTGIGYIIWYQNPTQKLRRDITQIMQAQLKMTQKEAQITALLEKRKLELATAKTTPIADDIFKAKTGDVEKLTTIQDSLRAGQKELSELRTKLQDTTEMSQVLGNADTTALRAEINSILRKHFPENIHIIEESHGETIQTVSQNP